ncbi:large-conductance mechanosensitive channel protein MscL [Helcococcus massiliensis]|uniref:large-conductance mechanosensitive channel protein MscL n=1 Tax=Helcococcus massiliensis TaxID=2040290 RepID=UPI000CDEEEB4|nr:large-conductance mechanosensitive channel protein MscL [Helcococcus massiliensis]
MLKEFKKFIAQGNVIDLAIGMIIGASFKAIVDSFVNDIVSPILGIFLGGIDFSQLSITVGQAQIMYGNFINSVISFLIIAFVLFMVVKAINTAKERMSRNKAVEEAAEEAAPSKEEVLLTEIRDLLKK